MSMSPDIAANVMGPLFGLKYNTAEKSIMKDPVMLAK